MKIEVPVPDGESNGYFVQTFTVSKDQARFSSMRGEYVPPGTYKRLIRGTGFNKVTVMSNTPMEVRTNYEFIQRAEGRVLINGLGLGMVLGEILKKPEVTEVWVIEISQDVIDLVGPTFSHDPRLKIIHADAMEYKPPKGEKFDCVWHDIWDNITSDNLESMKILHRRYANRTKWQDSWQKDLCRSYKRRGY